MFCNVFIFWSFVQKWNELFMLQIDLIEIALEKKMRDDDMHSVLICCDVQHIAFCVSIIS